MCTYMQGMSARLPLNPVLMSAPLRPGPGRRAWAGSLVVALLIALASALLPGAMPASQSVGSAFNPATTQVALNRDDSEHSVLATPQEDRDRSLLTGGGDDILTVMAVLAIAVVMAAFPRTAPLPPLALQAPARSASVRPGSGPRAPPAFA